MARTTQLLLERARYILALVPQALAVGPAGIVGWFAAMNECAKLIFVVIIDTLADGESAVCTVVEATDGAGTGAQNIATATATAVAGAGASRLQITMNTPLVADTVTITFQGVAYPFAAAAAENIPAHEFDQSAGDNAAATSLAACINDATDGIPGITAVANAAVVTLTVDEVGVDTIDVVATAPLTTVPVTLEAVVLIEVDGTALTAGFDHVAIRVAGPVTAHATALAIQSDLRYAPMIQPVAAQDADF